MYSVTAFFTHRILPDAERRDYSDHHDPTYGEFRDFLNKVAAKRTFISSADMAEAVRNGDSLEGTAHVSLDDGFASTTMAAEICADLGIPLTVFALSAPLDGYVPWFVQRTAALAAHGGAVRFRGESFDTRDMNRATDLHNAIKREVYGVPSAEQLDAVSRILEECSLSVSDDLDKFRFLNREELRRLADSGVEIGGHGHTHCALPGESGDVLAREIGESKVALESALGRPVQFFSYPDGAHDESICRRVAEAGYGAAFSVATEAAPTALMSIPRFSFGRFRFHWNKAGGAA